MIEWRCDNRFTKLMGGGEVLELYNLMIEELEEKVAPGGFSQGGQ
jgi:hypothetical protein